MLVTTQTHLYEAGVTDSGESLADFRCQFQFLHAHSPLKAIKLFLFYVGTRGIDPVACCMAFWATAGTTYISLLLDTDRDSVQGLTPEIAGRAAPHLSEVDPQFLFKLTRVMAALKEPEDILRALRLTPALGDYSILIPWLRGLGLHPDSHIRSRSAKLLCQLRPTKGLLDSHLQSADSRIRASVLEALWEPKVICSGQDVLPFFRKALADSNHRVVANALVGLYRLGETDALYRMIELCSSKQQLFRAATAWAMGAVEDRRAVPALRELASDRSFIVRQRAAESLLTLAH